MQGCLVDKSDPTVILSGFSDESAATEKEKTAFAGGEAAYLLNAYLRANTGLLLDSALRPYLAGGANIWSRQSDGTDGYPIFADATNKPVYAVLGGDGGGAVIADANGSSVSFSSQYVQADETVTLSVTTAEGYLLSKLSVNTAGGELLGSDSGQGVETLVFTMPETDVIVTSEFVAIASLAAEYTLTFHANGGTFNPADASDTTRTLQVEGGQKILSAQIPADPTRASGTAAGVTTNYTFAGWYLDPGGTSAYDSNLIIIENDDIYAKWTESYAYTVTFDANEGTFPDDGSTSKSRQVNAGGLASSPDPDPVRENGEDGFVYGFAGWYTNASGTGGAFDFLQTPVTGNLTLYAGWDGAVMITFDLNCDGAQAGDVPPPQTRLWGKTVDEPSGFIADATTCYTTVTNGAETINVARHLFKGWYTAPSGGARWDFAAPLSASEGNALTLYAHWETTDLFDALIAGGGNIFGSQEMLTVLAEHVQAGNDYSGQSFGLTQGITLDAGWQGIGTAAHPFNGAFAGNGYTVTLDGAGAPLFGYVGDNGTVSGLNLTAVSR